MILLLKCFYVSFGLSTNSGPYRNIIVPVAITIEPQKSRLNKVSVEYSDGNITQAMNIAIAISKTEGN